MKRTLTNSCAFAMANSVLTLFIIASLRATMSTQVHQFNKGEKRGSIPGRFPKDARDRKSVMADEKQMVRAIFRPPRLIFAQLTSAIRLHGCPRVDCSKYRD